MDITIFFQYNNPPLPETFFLWGEGYGKVKMCFMSNEGSILFQKFIIFDSVPLRHIDTIEYFCNNEEIDINCPAIINTWIYTLKCLTIVIYKNI